MRCVERKLQKAIEYSIQSARELTDVPEDTCLELGERSVKRVSHCRLGAEVTRV